jgi:hypothetical protein
MFGGGAGGGKSALGCYWLLKNCYKYPNSRWMLSRAVLKSLKETTLPTFFEICQKQGIGLSEYRFNQSSGTITFHRTGSQILMKDIGHNPSDPEYQRLGGLELTGAFIDEAAEVRGKAINIVASRIRYKLKDFNLKPKLLMSCNPVKNWVYNEYYRPDRDGTIEEHKAFVQSLVTDNPHISEHYIEELERLDPISRRRLLLGDWEYEDSEDKLFQYDKLIDMFSNDYVQQGDGIITCDVARFGKDKCVIMVWSGMILLTVWSIGKSTLTSIADKIQEFQRKYKIPNSNVIIDEDGMGGGVVDMIRGSKGFNNGSKALKKENYVNLKSQCYFKLADAVNKGQIYIKDIRVKKPLLEELEIMKIDKIDVDTTKVGVIRKDKIKQLLGRSPDYGDAMMMRMYYELGQNKITYYG